MPSGVGPCLCMDYSYLCVSRCVNDISLSRICQPRHNAAGAASRPDRADRARRGAPPPDARLPVAVARRGADRRARAREPRRAVPPGRRAGGEPAAVLRRRVAVDARGGDERDRAAAAVRLCGIALVPVAYGIGRRLASERAGVALAALVAVHPLLVYYSQEARGYAAVALACAVGFFYFLDAVEGRRGALGWAVASAVALGCHYFAIFPIAIEAAILLARRGRAALPALAGVGVVGLGPAPARARADRRRAQRERDRRRRAGGAREGGGDELAGGRAGRGDRRARMARGRAARGRGGRAASVRGDVRARRSSQPRSAAAARR